QKKRKNQKRPQPERQHQKHRPVLRPIKIRKSLPPNIRPPPRKKPFRQINQTRRSQRQHGERHRDSARNAQPEFHAPGLPDRESRHSGSDHRANSPAQRIPPTLPLKIRPPPNREQRRHLPDRQQRQKRKAQARQKPHRKSFAHRSPRNRNRHLERQKLPQQ